MDRVKNVWRAPQTKTNSIFSPAWIFNLLLRTVTMPRILFVSGFHPATRARDLAYEFERYVSV